MCIADGSINFLLNSEKVTFNVFNLLLNELTPPPSRYKNTFKLYIPVVTNCFILFPSVLFYLSKSYRTHSNFWSTISSYPNTIEFMDKMLHGLWISIYSKVTTDNTHALLMISRS